MGKCVKKPLNLNWINRFELTVGRKKERNEGKPWGHNQQKIEIEKKKL